jgi:hypothetical protein
MNYKHHTYAKKAMIARLLEAGRKRLKVFNPRTLENFLTREMSLSWEKWRVKSTKIGKEYDFYFVQAPTNDLRWKKVGGFYEVEALGWVGGQVKALETSPNKMDRFLGELVKLKPDMQKTDFSIKGGTYLSNPSPISLFILSWRDGHAEEIIDIDLELKIREDRLTNLLIKKMFEVGGYAQALPLDVPPPVIVDVDKEVIVEEVKPSDLVDESSRVYQGLILKEEDMDGARFGYGSTHEHLRRRLVGMDKSVVIQKYNAKMDEAYRKFAPLFQTKTEQSVVRSEPNEIYEAYKYLVDYFKKQRPNLSKMWAYLDTNPIPFKERFKRPISGKSFEEIPLTDAEKMILDDLDPEMKMKLVQRANFFEIKERYESENAFGIRGANFLSSTIMRMSGFEGGKSEQEELILKIRNHPKKPGRLPAYDPRMEPARWFFEFFKFLDRNQGQIETYLEILEEVGFNDLVHKYTPQGRFKYNNDFSPRQSVADLIRFVSSTPYAVYVNTTIPDKLNSEYIKPATENPHIALLDGLSLDDFPMPRDIFGEYRKLGVELHLIKSYNELDSYRFNTGLNNLPNQSSRAYDLMKSNEGSKINKLLTAGLFALQICKQYPNFNLTRIIWVLQRGRAHANNSYRGTAIIQVGYDNDVSVAIHEVMHSLEYYCPEIRNYGTAFYCNQVDDPKKQVSACSASGEYSSNYSGKIYPVTASEIVTTTMEPFESKESLTRFAQNYPEYFLFAYNIRNGLVK